MLRVMTLLLAAFTVAMTAGSCGSGNDACDGFSCETGFSCLIEDGNPTCVPDGDGGGGSGTGQAGDACDTDSDCQLPLTCQADLNGDTVCTE